MTTAGFLLSDVAQEIPRKPFMMALGGGVAALAAFCRLGGFGGFWGLLGKLGLSTLNGADVKKVTNGAG
jgi:hypothetical protein